LKLEYGKSLPAKVRDSSGQYPVFGSGGQVGVHSSALTKSPAVVVGRKGSIGALFFSKVSCWPIDTTYFIDKFPPYINPKYVYFFLRILGLEKLNKAAAIPGLNRDDIHRLAVPIPFAGDPTRSLDSQQRIVMRIEALLAEIKKAHTLLEQMHCDVDRLMKASLVEVFGRVRDGFEVTDIPQNQVKRIGDVAKLERGKFSHRPRNDRRFFGGNVPWIQIQNLPRDYRKYITEPMSTLNNQGVAISKIFPKGTLVLSIAATIGAVGILSFDACFPDSLVGITPDTSSIDTDFLYWQLVFIRNYLDTIAPSAAQKNVNLQILSRINLWVPSLKEQRIINTYLDSSEIAVEKMQLLLDQDSKLLDQLEQSILERAFRGEL
jgi:type I restriction enzyme S subunit